MQVGQLLGVDKILSGSLTKVGEIYTINLKLVNVENGEIELSHVLDIRGNMEDVLRGGCYEMAQVFSGSKKPGKTHTVLSSEKRNIWPWIVGGVMMVGIGAGSYLYLNQLNSDPEVDEYSRGN